MLFRHGRSPSADDLRRSSPPPWDRVVMAMRPQTYTERAHHCEQMAFRVRDAEAKSKFVQLARQWHARAAQEGETRPPEAAAAAQA